MWGGKQTKGRLGEQLDADDSVGDLRELADKVVQGFSPGNCNPTLPSDDTWDTVSCVFVSEMGCSMEAEFRMKNSKLVEFKGMEPVLRTCKNIQVGDTSMDVCSVGFESSHIMIPYSDKSFTSTHACGGCRGMLQIVGYYRSMERRWLVVSRLGLLFWRTQGSIG